MGNLTGKISVVTGAARGIGVAIAERQAKEGASVVVADINGEDLNDVCKKLEDAGAPKAIGIAADLSKEEGAGVLFEAALDVFGRVDILVNNAGGGVIRPFLEHTPETLRQTIDRNLWTAIWCIRAFLPGMVERSYGRVVNIGADSVHTGTFSHAGYNAAKGGVHAMTTGLAFEFAKHGVTFNTVSPGGVLTPDVEALMNDDGTMMKKYNLKVNPREVAETYIPIKRFTKMEEVAALVAFLAGDDAAAINGQTYSINGGQWMM